MLYQFLIYIILGNYAYHATLLSGQHVNSTVQLIAIVFRHGERAPEKLYTENEANDWPEGIGQLTKEGTTQMFHMGVKLREYYEPFVADCWAKDVKVQSSDYDRCMMSAALLLAGMFPPPGDCSLTGLYPTEEKQGQPLCWQPIPIHADRRLHDKMIAAKAPCPCFEEEMDRINEQLETEYENETKLYYADLSSKITNENPIDSIGDLELLLTSVKIEQEHNLHLPDWATQLLNDKEAEKFIALSLERFTKTDVAKRFQTGVLIKDIIEKMENKKNNVVDTKKVYLYSAHDVTLVSLWKVFGFEEHIVPDYGEALVLELHLDQGIHFVQLFRRSWNGSVMELLAIPRFGKRCSLEKFVTLTQSVAVDETTWDKECQQTPCGVPLQSGSAAQSANLIF